MLPVLVNFTKHAVMTSEKEQVLLYHTSSLLRDRKQFGLHIL